MKKEIIKDFHALEFMRKKREKLSEKYLKDKTQYLKDIKASGDKFREEKQKDSVKSIKE